MKKQISLQTHTQATVSINREDCGTEMMHLVLQSALDFPS